MLDHSGPDLAFITYGAAIKLWVLGSLLVSMFLPVLPAPYRWAGSLAAVLAMIILAGFVGTVESVMARLRLVRVPRLLIAASALAIIAVILVVR